MRKLLIILLVMALKVDALAVSPAEIDFRISKGGYGEKDLVIFNTDNDERIYSISAVGRDWFEIDPSTVKLREGDKRDVKLRVDVPERTENGIYENKVYVTEVTGSKGIVIQKGVGVKANVEVVGGEINRDVMAERDKDVLEFIEEEKDEAIEKEEGDFDFILKSPEIMIFFLFSFLILLLSFAIIYRSFL